MGRRCMIQEAAQLSSVLEEEAVYSWLMGPCFGHPCESDP